MVSAIEKMAIKYVLFIRPEGRASNKNIGNFNSLQMQMKIYCSHKTAEVDSWGNLMKWRFTLVNNVME